MLIIVILNCLGGLNVVELLVLHLWTKVNCLIKLNFK